MHESTNSTLEIDLPMTSPGNASTFDQSKQIFFEFVLHGVVLNMIGMIGLVGNLVCIIILRRPKMRRNSTHVILATLATFDFLLIITSILMLGMPAVYRYTLDPVFALYYYDVFPYVTPWVYAFGLIAQTGSIYCTLMVTVERYIVVCWPLRSSTICTYGRSKIGVACIVVFAILYNIPRFFEVSWKVDIEPDPEWPDHVNVTDARPQIVMTDLRQDPYYISVYITWMYLVFMYVFPFGGLSVLNLLMFLDVRRSNARQSTLSPHEKKELRLAVMLMVVVLVFLTCNILPLIVNILEVLSIEVKPLTETSNLLVTFNSSVNVFIYIIFGEKFQKQFLQWVRSLWCFGRHVESFATAAAATPIHNNNITRDGQRFQPTFTATVTTPDGTTWFAKCKKLTSIRRIQWPDSSQVDTQTTFVLKDSKVYSNGKSQESLQKESGEESQRSFHPIQQASSTSFNNSFCNSDEGQEDQLLNTEQKTSTNPDDLRNLSTHLEPDQERTPFILRNVQRTAC